MHSNFVWPMNSNTNWNFCLSACLKNHCVLLKRLYITNFFAAHMDIILVLLESKWPYKIPRVMLNGGVKYREYKNCRFRPTSPFVSETVRDRFIVSVDYYTGKS